MDPVELVTGDNGMVPFIGIDIFPGERRMAITTMSAKLELIPVILPALPMAVFTGRRSSFENQIEVTFPAGNGSMFSDEWKIGFIMCLSRPAELFLYIFKCEHLRWSQDQKCNSNQEQ
jgi:hypothetical protein